MKTKPIVFQINSSCNRGSTGRIAEQIGRAAQERGYECYIAYGRYYQPSELNAIKMGNKFTNAIHGISSRILDNHGLMSTEPTKNLVKQMKEIKPDIVHLHNIHGYFLNYKVLFEYLASAHIPIVWTLHDCWPFTGHCAYFDFAGCNLWETGCHAPCPCKKGYPESLLMDASKKNYELKKKLFTSVDNLTLVPVSEWLGDLVSKSYLNKNPIKVIHNGIDVEKFKPQVDTEALKKRYNISNKNIVLGVAAIWEPRKGFDDFLKLRNELPANYIIVLVGVSAEQKKMLPEGVIGVEHTESLDELVKLYSSANVFVNPTYEDNFPTTNLEALACGTPVITYKTGGSVEAVFDGTGSVVEQGDIFGLKTQIELLCSKDRTRMRHECRQRAIDNFKAENRFEDYVDLYDSLIDKE